MHFVLLFPDPLHRFVIRHQVLTGASSLLFSLVADPHRPLAHRYPHPHRYLLPHTSPQHVAYALLRYGKESQDKSQSDEVAIAPAELDLMGRSSKENREQIWAKEYGESFLTQSYVPTWEYQSVRFYKQRFPQYIQPCTACTYTATHISHIFMINLRVHFRSKSRTVPVVLRSKRICSLATPPRSSLTAILRLFAPSPPHSLRSHAHTRTRTRTMFKIVSKKDIEVPAATKRFVVHSRESAAKKKNEIGRHGEWWRFNLQGGIPGGGGEHNPFHPPHEPLLQTDHLGVPMDDVRSFGVSIEIAHAQKVTWFVGPHVCLSSVYFIASLHSSAFV